MNRNLDKLAEKEYDVLVVGGGVYGAATAREAALRGLAVAIIDKKDFCGATSANSLKIIHGGLRYLQQMDILRTRESAVQRRNMMGIAPHLIHPLPCIMPTRGHLMKSKAALFMGMLANDIISFDRNSSGDPEKHIPMGKVVPRSKCLEILDGLNDERVTGGAIWHDAFAYNTEKFVLGMVLAAADAGADAANYVEFIGFKKADNRVTGALVKDALSGKELEISCKLVINNTGPWVNKILELAGTKTEMPVNGLSLGINLVFKRQLMADYAAGLSVADADKERLMFLMPWRDKTIGGTFYRTYEGSPDNIEITESDIGLLLEDLNKAYPPAKLEHKDIALVHAGLLPTQDTVQAQRDPKLMNHYRLVDHAHSDGIEGLISVLGVKYTTACDVAHKTIDMAAGKLESKCPPSNAHKKPLSGGNVPDFNSFMENIKAKNLPTQLAYNYGSDWGKLAELYGESDALKTPVCEDTHVLGAEIVHAVRNEMAMTLSDVIFRRTDLGSAGIPPDNVLQKCSNLMASELKWDNTRAAKEISLAKSVQYPGSERISSQ